MTIAHEQQKIVNEIKDLSKYAAQEATTRIMDIASLADNRQMAVMIGIKASKMMLEAYVITAIEEAGMPRNLAEVTAKKSYDDLMEHIAGSFKKVKVDA